MAIAGLGRERIGLVLIPLALIVTAAFIPVLAMALSIGMTIRNFLENPLLPWAWVRPVEVGLEHVLGRGLPTADLFTLRVAICGLETRSSRLPPDQRDPARRQRGRPLRLDRDLARTMSQADLCVENPWTCSMAAGLATVLFMVHPLRVEAVAWATCQSYLWCALFSMLAVLAYLRAFEIETFPWWGWLIASFVLFVAALLSHAIAVSLPAVLLILDVYPLRRFGDGPGRWFGSSSRSVWREKVPFITASIVFTGLAVAAKPQTWDSTEPLRCVAMPLGPCVRYRIWFYFVKTMWPLDLIGVLPVTREDRLARSPVRHRYRRDAGCERRLISAAPPLARTAGGVAFLPGDPGAQFRHHPDQRPERSADRYSYMAMLGSVTVAAACLCWVCQTFSRGRIGAIAINMLCLGAVVGLLPMTWSQGRTWHDSTTLWTHALAHGARSSSVAHYQLGVALYSGGHIKAATAQYAEALRFDPTDFAHNNLGVILSRQEDD